mgnify:CR=1 FL=1
MTELLTPSQHIAIASPEFLENHTDHTFSPLLIDCVRFTLEQGRVDLETPNGITFFIQLSKGLYSPTDPDHGWHHISTVLENSLFLAKKYQLKEQEVYALLAAACLHDVIRYDVPNPAQCSAEIAEHILQNHMQPLTVKWTTSAIDQHSSPRSKRYFSDIVSETLYDADKMHTDPFRWVNCGLNPYAVENNSIETAYRTSLEEIHGTIGTYPAHEIIEWRMAEREALKNASEY